MLLSPRQLEYFENYIVDTMEKNKKDNWDYSRYDIVHVYYYKKEKTLFGTKDKTWSESFTFKRNESPDEEKEGYITYKTSPQCTDLISQLDLIVKDNIKIISKEDYDFFKKEFPERFI